MKSPINFSMVLSLCLAGAAPVVLNSCDGYGTKAEAAHLAAQAELSALKAAKAKLESEVKQVEKGQADLMNRNEELQKEADEAKAQIEKLQDEAAKARKDLEEHMAKYKVGQRAKLKGLSLANLKTSSWQSFDAVVVKEVTPTELVFTHSQGIAHVPLAQLAPDLQRKFHYDPDELKRKEEAKAVQATVADELEEIEGVDVEEMTKDPTRTVNPVVVQNLKQRILQRQREIEKAKAEAMRVKEAGDDRTNIGKYRLQILGQRAARMRAEIKALSTMLEKELNG
ncbi:MAG: hypothetical protein ACKV19_21095 [Verrucomicrobiales bacterium]